MPSTKASTAISSEQQKHVVAGERDQLQRHAEGETGDRQDADHDAGGGADQQDVERDAPGLDHRHGEAGEVGRLPR